MSRIGQCACRIGGGQKAGAGPALDLNGRLPRRGQKAIYADSMTLIVFHPRRHRDFVSRREITGHHQTQVRAGKFIR